MTWIAPHVQRIDEPFTADERTTLDGYLDYGRSSLPLKCAGPTGNQLALQAGPPSTLSLLGLLRHITDVERTWFRIRRTRLDRPGQRASPVPPNPRRPPPRHGLPQRSIRPHDTPLGLRPHDHRVLPTQRPRRRQPTPRKARRHHRPLALPRSASPCRWRPALLGPPVLRSASHRVLVAGLLRRGLVVLPAVVLYAHVGLCLTQRRLVASGGGGAPASPSASGSPTFRHYAALRAGPRTSLSLTLALSSSLRSSSTHTSFCV